MQIKNIQQYRSFYKTTRPVSQELEEHFIGNYYIDPNRGVKKFGWFTMYHGDRDGFSTPEAGIENFLQSFLDMAKDGQAVYEFLQNAVDAGSTHYTMVWGQDEIDGNYYLLVANNGEMFTPNSIRSILNVGSSTKNADSQTIGKFGIGFKLAHRLVGKDNGLQELINENSGPLLFSWKNYELERLAENSSPVPTDISMSKNNKGEIIIEDDNPWLFKILITCFPCLPENDSIVEMPKMANGIQANANPFSKAEYEVLSRWVKKNQHILNKETYEEGALFFIKLGSGKESELAEINLKEGVKFALAILKETADTEAKKEKVLHTVQLNNEDPITYPDLEYIKLTVDKETEKDTYAYIRFGVENHNDLSAEQKKKIAEEANIETLFGFRKHNEIGDYFKGAPNLYLYFPLSEEVHNFNYILHSNAFYKGSSRTFLHKGSSKEDGINERLLKIIVNKIDEELNRLSSSANPNDRHLFLHLYAALLTSEKSTNQDRLWIEAPYINRINELLLKYIPIRSSSDTDEFTITDNNANVFIKKTKIDIDTQSWGLENVNWFYWGEEAEDVIRNAAFAKLNVKDFTIFNLLKTNEKISTSLNSWINNDTEKIKCILKEIAALDTEMVKDNSFKDNLFNTKLLKFNNEELLTINEFQEKEKDGYFIVFNKLQDIKDLLHKLDLKYSTENFDDFNFNPKYFSFFTSESQVKSYTILTKLFSRVVSDEKLHTLNAAEKHRIFEAFRTLNDTPGDRMAELKLFTNNNGQPVCFKNLYSDSEINWLHKFCINSSENNSAYKNYLLSKQEDVYEGIVFPFWEQIATFIASNPDKAKEILDDLVLAYEKSSWPEKTKSLLSSWKQIIYRAEVIESDAIYFNSELEALPEKTFSNIQNTAFKYFGIHIPDKFLLPYLGNLPFSFSSVTVNPTIADTAIKKEQIADLLQFSKTCNIDFFDSNCIVLKEGAFCIDSTSGKKQISTNKSAIVRYILSYYPDEYELIPEIFSNYKNKIELSDSKLVEHLIERFEENDLTQELELIEIVLKERYEDKEALLNKITSISLDAAWEEERKNETYIKLLRDIIEKDITQEVLSSLHNKLSVDKGSQEINIGDIDSAHDSVEVYRADKKIILSQSQILSLNNADNIKMIQQFHDEARKRDLLSQQAADKLFKISNIGITDDLVALFKANLKDNNLKNAHQILFVLLSGKFKKEEFKDYSVKSKDGDWYSLERQLVIYSEENECHIKHSFLLDSSYNDIQSLLSISDLEIFNYNDEEEEDIIIPRFLFAKGCSTEILISDENIESKLNYLYKGWKRLPAALRVSKPNQTWVDYLGISPNQYILNGIMIKEETLPDEFIAWYQNDKKKDDFLKAIGVYVGDSPIEKIRKYLIGQSNEMPFDIEMERFNETLLSNTVYGLSGKFISLNNNPIIYDENKHLLQLSIIEKIIGDLLLKKAERCMALIYHTANTFRVLYIEPSTECICKINEELHNKLKTYVENKLNILYDNYNILKDSLHGLESSLEDCVELEFEKTFIPGNNQMEHDEPFYHNWKSEHKINLYREDDLQFDCNVDIKGESTIIGRISEGTFYSNDAGEFWEIFYNKKISLEELSNELSKENEELAEAIKDLIRRRNIMLTSIYNTLNAAGKSEVKSAHLEALESAFKEEDQKQKRKELIENIKENNEYSYAWFESYLKFLLTFESKQDTTSQKSISFQEIKRYLINGEISNKYFLLCGASSLIPLNIEDFEDFKITLIIKNRQNVNIKVEGVSKKGQDLLIYCREPIPQPVISTFNDVIQIKISFSPVIDLLEKLYKAFVNRLNMDEWDDVKDTLPKLQFIYGPPGTGKTTTLCNKIIEGIKEKYNAKFLILTPTNKAADVLCKKLLKSSNSPADMIGVKLHELDSMGKSISITRLGKPTDPELEVLDVDIYQDSLNMERLDYTNVLASTIHRIPYFEVIDEEEDNYIKLFKLQDYWDCVVFDEASMTNLPYLVFAIMAIYKFNPNAEFIIAGDPKQIPPVVDINDKDLEELDIQDENVYRMMNISSFKEEEQILRVGDSISNLDRQYRSVKQIGQLFSDLSYSNLLKHDRDDKMDMAKQLPAAFRKLINKNVTFIDIPLSMENSIFRINKLLYSSYHTYSAILVAEIIKYFDSVLDENDNWTIGLIAPYKAQAILLNKLITSYGISDKLKIYSDTVHGFQGDECDMVFFISNPNNYYYTGHSRCLLSKEYIYNVAISRARDYLIILHPFNTIKNNPYINGIKDSYSENIEEAIVHKAEEIEKILFKQKDFIEKNSYITGHDNVNVFGQIEMKYFIKANDNAIDIQLRKFNN